MGFKLPVSFPEFIKNPKEAITYLAIIGLCVLFTILYKIQESRLQDAKEETTKCETKNYLQDVQISILQAGKAKSDSLVNRIMGKLEAIEELKK